MSIGELILVSLGVIALALDIFVRLVIAPDRRDKLLDTLLESIMEPEPLEHMTREDEAAEVFPDPLARSLFRHFEQSATSRQVLRVLADRESGMSEAEVLAGVNSRLVERRKPPLPEAVVKKVVHILQGAGLVALERGRFVLTALGARLNSITEGSEGRFAVPASFVSR